MSKTEPVCALDLPPMTDLDDDLKERLAEDRVTRLALLFLDRYEGIHLKDQVVDWMGANRRKREEDALVLRSEAALFRSQTVSLTADDAAVLAEFTARLGLKAAPA